MANQENLQADVLDQSDAQYGLEALETGEFHGIEEITTDTQTDASSVLSEMPYENHSKEWSNVPFID